MTSGTFGMRFEIENEEIFSEDFVHGYFKGIRVALSDLGFDKEVIFELSSRLETYHRRITGQENSQID